ncbi:nucleotidyl transferase AbiEii/AbiGii toxin family protein [Thermococcus sibiricus]|uniref:nucleotidyl transferase AbiEii/AbiGii toxin family protein n=1 Tax=Thermococcus sibiricus TaxID=172049 RepID=UPI001E5E0981|nr:nucleotidyl transferase AbiEii/AbiGii toxin family protein [Thermococcus sibiricus]
MKSPFLDSYPTMFRVYSLEDLLAKKVVALYSRMEGKDIYDVFHALNLDLEVDKFLKALELNLRFYRIEGDFWSELIDKLAQAKENARQIGNSTNHFIPKTLRPNWEELIESLRFRMRKFSSE